MVNKVKLRVEGKDPSWQHMSERDDFEDVNSCRRADQKISWYIFLLLFKDVGLIVKGRKSNENGGNSVLIDLLFLNSDALNNSFFKRVHNKRRNLWPQCYFIEFLQHYQYLWDLLNKNKSTFKEREGTIFWISPDLLFNNYLIIVNTLLCSKALISYKWFKRKDETLVKVKRVAF